MAIGLTPAALAALSETLKSPNLVLDIEGVGTLYGAGVIEEVARIGSGIKIGGFKLGANTLIGDQSNIITVNGTSTSIKQTLDPAKGQGSNVSTLSIALMDSGQVTELITPGQVVTDILSAKARVYLGFQGTSWPEDYSVVFRGFITDITADAGKVTFLINGTDERQRSSIYTKATVDAVGAIGVNDQTITLASFDSVLRPVMGPDGTYDQSFKAYFRIDDEIIGWTSVQSQTTNGVTTFSIGGLTRGAFGTTPAAHEDGASADTFYRLTGNAIDLALKLMSSGNTLNQKSQAFTSLPITSVGIGGADYVFNSIYFSRLINDNDLGLTIGDWVTITGSQVSANNRTAQVVDVVQTVTGCFVKLSTTLIDEPSSLGIASFTSQFATFPDGCQMAPDEIDIAQFQRIKQLYLNSATLDFYLKDTIDSAKEFLETQIYLPLSAYSIPRKAKSSVGYFSGPIPGNNIVTFDSSNVKSPSNISVSRSTNKNFYNEIVFKYDEDPVEDQYDSGYIGLSETSKARIGNTGNKTLVIEAKGLRSTSGAGLIVQDQVKRRFNRYQFGAETFQFSSLLGDGYTVEVGDIVLFDGTLLSLPDIKTGQKGVAPRLLEIQNKEIQLKTGDLKFTAIDTNFSGQGRHALISPSSLIAMAQDRTSFTIYNSSVATLAPIPEYYKWQKLVGAWVQVRSQDYQVVGRTKLIRADSNHLTVSPALSFTPTEDMVLEFAPYSAQDSKTQHLVYGYMRDTVFGDGSAQYTMI